jgi:hypothetical protein
MPEQPKQFANLDAYPAEALNPSVRLGAATIRFTGATGLVGTAFGIPGITATRMATGHYRVAFPRSPARSMKFQATPVSPTGYQGPTGVGFNVQLANRSAPSGTIDIFTTRGHPSGAAINLTSGIPMNPPDLSEVDLLVFTTPITRY